MHGSIRPLVKDTVVSSRDKIWRTSTPPDLRNLVYELWVILGQPSRGVW